MVIQLLKDHSNPYTVTGSPSRDTAHTQKSKPEGYWLLNKLVFDRDKKDDVNFSHHLLENELQAMKLVSPYHQALQAVFLREEASNNEYEDLQRDAGEDLKKITHNLAIIRERKNPRAVDLIRAVAEGQTPNTRLLRDVELGIHELTNRLSGVRLDVEFPDLIERNYTSFKTDRRISTEESYDEYYRVFKAWCETLKTQHTKYRSKAMDATSVTCSIGRNTVERAVIFGEAKENPV